MCVCERERETGTEIETRTNPRDKGHGCKATPTWRKQKVCWLPRKLAIMATTVLIVVHRYAEIESRIRLLRHLVY